jgi:hypothetical protein
VGVVVEVSVGVDVLVGLGVMVGVGVSVAKSANPFLPPKPRIRMMIPTSTRITAKRPITRGVGVFLRLRYEEIVSETVMVVPVRFSNAQVGKCILPELRRFWEWIKFRIG